MKSQYHNNHLVKVLRERNEIELLFF